MREAMRGLAQGIVASYDARVMDLASIRRDVSAQRERDQRHIQELEAPRRRAARALHSHLAKGRADLKASVSTQLRELDRAHNAMAKELRADLSKVKPPLGGAEAARRQDEVQRGQDRGQVVTQRRSDVGAQIQELDQAHNAMGQELRADLSKGHADLGASVSAQLHELAVAHQAMARQQQEGLAKVHADLNRAETKRKAGVHSWMEEVAAAHGAAREEWQNLAGTMRARRAGVVVAEAPPVVEEVAPAETVEKEAGEGGEVTEELASLTRRVFAYLASHPDGARLSELEREIGLGRFQAARLVRRLMNDGKAKKQGLLYVAT